MSEEDDFAKELAELSFTPTQMAEKMLESRELRAAYERGRQDEACNVSAELKEATAEIARLKMRIEAMLHEKALRKWYADLEQDTRCFVDKWVELQAREGGW